MTDQTTATAPAEIPFDPNATHILANVKFNFKTRSLKDDNNKVLKTYPKQASVIAALPYVTAKFLVDALLNESEENSKLRWLIVDSVNEEIKAQAKSQFDQLIDDNLESEGFQVSASMLDMDKLSLEYISQLEPAARGARGISDEEWETFFKDYMAVMPAVTGKEVKRIEYHLQFLKKPAKLRMEPDALKMIVEQLDIYISSSPAIEDTIDCAKRLQGRFQKWLTGEATKVDLSAF